MEATLAAIMKNLDLMNASIQKLDARVQKQDLRFEKIANRLEILTAQKPEIAAKPSFGGGHRSTPFPSPASSVAPSHVLAYDDAVSDALRNFKMLGLKIGGDCANATTQVVQIFDDLRNFLWVAAGKAEPDTTILQKMIEPIGRKIETLGSLCGSKRNTPHFNHLSALSEGIQAVGWVTVKPIPAPFVKDFIDSAMFYINRVLKDHKDDAEATHCDFVKSWVEILNSLQKFVRNTHTTGLVWNSAPGSAPVISSGPPPPGPPPPPPPPADLLTKASGDEAGRNALFADLNQGSGVTSRLKKVTADMQTHKNPNLRSSSTVPESVGSKKTKTTIKTALNIAKPPKLQLENGKQWIVEYYKNARDLVIPISDKKETLYVYKCEGSVLRVQGKCNSITLDGCKKMAIAFDGVVAQVETINCQSVEIQTLGEMPTLSIQKTDGCQVYLSEQALTTEIVTSKSSEMNAHVPHGDGEFVELPLPEQFKTVLKNGKLETSVSDI